MYRSLLLYFLLISCTPDSERQRAEIRKLINSNDKGSLVEGFNLVGESKDTSFVRDIFTNPDDPRVSNNSRFKGISVYQAKMTAIKKITQTEPPAKITYKPDTSIINFYMMVAKNKKLIK